MLPILFRHQQNPITCVLSYLHRLIMCEIHRKLPQVVGVYLYRPYSFPILVQNKRHFIIHKGFDKYCPHSIENRIELDSFGCSSFGRTMLYILHVIPDINGIKDPVILALFPAFQVFLLGSDLGILAEDRKVDQDQQYGAARLEQRIQDKDAIGILPVLDGVADLDSGNVYIYYYSVKAYKKNKLFEYPNLLEI